MSVLVVTILCIFFAPQIQTFNTLGPCTSVEELANGAAISQALNQM